MVLSSSNNNNSNNIVNNSYCSNSSSSYDNLKEIDLLLSNKEIYIFSRKWYNINNNGILYSIKYQV